MKLIIDKVEYNAKYNKRGKIVVKLKLNCDKIYFLEWEKEISNLSLRKDYVKDIEFEKTIDKGTLIGCFPQVNLNETKVIIIYDYIEGTKL